MKEKGRKAVYPSLVARVTRSSQADSLLLDDELTLLLRDILIKCFNVLDTVSTLLPGSKWRFARRLFILSVYLVICIFPIRGFFSSVMPKYRWFWRHWYTSIRYGKGFPPQEWQCWTFATGMRGPLVQALLLLVLLALTDHLYQYHSVYAYIWDQYLYHICGPERIAMCPVGWV